MGIVNLGAIIVKVLVAQTSVRSTTYLNLRLSELFVVPFVGLFVAVRKRREAEGHATKVPG